MLQASVINKIYWCVAYGCEQSRRPISRDILYFAAHVSSAPAYMPSRDAKCQPVFSYAREYICGVGNKLIIQQTVDNFCYALQLQQALTYLDKWFNFSESSVASVMSQIAFRKIPTFQNMMTVSTLLGLDMHQTKPRQPV